MDQFLKEKRFEKKLNEIQVSTGQRSREFEISFPADREHFQLVARGLQLLHDVSRDHVERREINFLLKHLVEQVPYDWFPQQDEMIED